jgi:hypothetical protein
MESATVFYRYGLQRPKKTGGIDLDLRVVSAALAMEKPEFPSIYIESLGVLQYIKDRYGTNCNCVHANDSDCLNSYSKSISAECSPVWTNHSLFYLRRLAQLSNDNILSVTPAVAQEFLDAMIAEGKEVSTRNRALAACNRFLSGLCGLKGLLKIHLRRLNYSPRRTSMESYIALEMKGMN